jgi:hypothetical protein
MVMIGYRLNVAAGGFIPFLFQKERFFFHYFSNRPRVAFRVHEPPFKRLAAGRFG